jgi:hypothetical protein
MHVYAPVLLAGDGRPVAIVHSMERALPGLHLEWTTSLDGKSTHLADRDTWLAQYGRERKLPPLHNGDMRDFVSVFGTEAPPSSAPGGQPQLEIHASFPLSAEGSAAAASVLEAVAEAARAFWGTATPFSARVDIVSQTKNRPDDLEPPARGLPAIKSPGAIRSHEIPHLLGWLNYWSAATARAIGFPEPARDAELLSRARRTASGGWVVRLTDAPLDLDLPAHLEALLRTYERFPEIGGRSAP